MQIGVHNDSKGGTASGDIVVTADNGSATDTYINLGINSSGWNQSTTDRANDGYLFVRGNTVTGGGNLVLGTLQNNDIVFTQGGNAPANEVARFAYGLGFAVESNLSVAQAANFNLITVANASTLNGLLTVNNSAVITGNITVNNSAVITGNITVAQASLFSSNLAINGLLTVNNSAVVTGNLTVSNNSTFDSNLAVLGTLQAQSAAVFTGPAQFNNNITVAAASTFSSNLTVNGAAQLGTAAVTGNLTVNNTAALGNLAVSGTSQLSNAAVSGNLVVIGLSQLNSAVLSGNITVAKDSTFIGNLAVNGNLVVGNFITISNTLIATTASIGSFDQINSRSFANVQVLQSNGYVSGNTWVVDGNSYNSNSTFQQVVDSWSTGSFRSAQYMLQITDTTTNSYQVSQMLLVQDGTDVYFTEYADIYTASSLGAWSADIAVGMVELLFTPYSSHNLTIKVVRTTIDI